MPNKNLATAKNTKNDEFYTQYEYIQKEVNAYLEYNPDVFRDKTILLPCDDPDWSNFTKFFAQNFETFGLKKLISTSYAIDKKPLQLSLFPSEVEEHSNLYDAKKTRSHGKLFILDHDINASGRIDITDLQMTQYLEGDGDFRCDEVKKLRDEADIIITNPPFSLYREFVAWLMETDKKYLIIGNLNSVTYREIFPLIMDNRMWLGATCNGSDMVFGVPKGATIKQSDREKAARLGYEGDYTRLGNSCWFTNLDHGRRHQPLSLMTMEENIKFSRHKEIRNRGYQKYDNFNAIEVPFTDAIPSNFDGVMGVPKSFMEVFCPEQFEIVGVAESWFGMSTKKYPKQIQVSPKGKCKQCCSMALNGGAALTLDGPLDDDTYYIVDGKYYKKVYARIFIRRKYDKDREKDILLIQNRLFRLFCERHKEKYTSAEMEDLFERYGIWDYMRDCYDMFHIEGDEAIYCELMASLRHSGADLCEGTELCD